MGELITKEAYIHRCPLNVRLMAINKMALFALGRFCLCGCIHTFSSGQHEILQAFSTTKLVERCELKK